MKTLSTNVQVTFVDKMTLCFYLQTISIKWLDVHMFENKQSIWKWLCYICRVPTLLGNWEKVPNLQNIFRTQERVWNLIKSIKNVEKFGNEFKRQFLWQSISDSHFAFSAIGLGVWQSMIRGISSTQAPTGESASPKHFLPCTCTMQTPQKATLKCCIE